MPERYRTIYLGNKAITATVGDDGYVELPRVEKHPGKDAADCPVCSPPAV